jgi:YVTN family beta-propeller protein
MKKSAIIVLALLFAACKKDRPEPATPETPVTVQPSQQKVYIINEGKFGSDNASVSMYVAGTGDIVKDQYHVVNNVALGDIAQSMLRFNDRYYIIVNNSKKLVVCDKDLKKITEVGSLPSPRYMLPVSSSKAYITDLAANRIHIFDIASNNVTGSIATSGWTERLVLQNNEVFVTNEAKGSVYVINPATDKITDSIVVGAYPGSMEVDKNGKIWVLASGDQFNNADAKLLRIDPASRTAELTLTFPSGSFPSALCLNKGKDTLLFLNNGVTRMPISSASLPAQPFIAAGTKMFYGLGVNPADHNIYVSDALDFIQSSTIYIYDNQGTNKSFFKAGINANSFYFE